MSALFQDIRFGLRMLVKNPVMTFAAIVTMALGIGANCAIFTLVDSVLLRPLPYGDPDRLVMVWENNLKRGRDRNVVSVANFFDWREQSESFEEMAAFANYDVTYQSGSEPERIPAGLATDAFFSTLGTKPLAGRLFLPEDFEPASPDVVVVSHRFWQSRFGGDPELMGETLNLESRAYTVIGVLPPRFQFAVRSTDVWRPWLFDEEDRANRRSHYLKVLARLKRGTEMSQAQAEMDGIAGRLAQEHPEWMKGWGVTVVPLHEEVVGKIRPALLVLLAAVALVLLIACANVANLLLSKATAREKEVALRISLGADRLRLIRQLLTESSLLSVLGGIAGVVTAYWGVRTLLALTPFEFPRVDEIAFDQRIFGFALLLSLLTGIVFGIAPALRASRTDLCQSLKEGGARACGGTRDRLRAALVVTEVALSVVLLVGAGLLIHSFWRLLQVDPGFNTKSALTVSLELPASKYPEIHQHNAFFQELIERFQVLPGVDSVGAVSDFAMSGPATTRSFVVEGRPRPDAEGRIALPFRIITADYFRAMGIPLLKGRVFTRSDDADAPLVLIINQSMARLFWPDEDPLGQRIQFQWPDGPLYEVIGVVGDTKYLGLDEPTSGAMYVPFQQKTWVWARYMTYVLRTEADPHLLSAVVREEVRILDADLPILAMRTVEEQVSRSLANRRFSLLLLGLFAAVALALAAVGVYGVIAYAVTQRTREIGLRMALGARRRNIVGTLLQQGMLLVAVGSAVGLVGALALSRSIETLIFEVDSTDPWTYLGVVLVISTVALVATLIPAFRASRVDPMVALRYE